MVRAKAPQGTGASTIYEVICRTGRIATPDRLNTHAQFAGDAIRGDLQTEVKPDPELPPQALGAIARAARLASLPNSEFAAIRKAVTDTQRVAQLAFHYVDRIVATCPCVRASIIRGQTE